MRKNKKVVDCAEISGSQETSKRLIEVAVDLFSTNGFARTSTRDIAQATRMTISNIYYHFGSKEGLLFAILELATTQIVGKLREVVATDMPVIERFKILLMTHLRLMLDTHRKESAILFLEEEHIIRISKQFQIDLLEMYRKELQHLQTLGYAKGKNLTVLAFNIFGVINWHIRWFKSDGQMSLEQITEEMIDFVLYGLLGSPYSRGNTPLG